MHCEIIQFMLDSQNTLNVLGLGVSANGALGFKITVSPNLFSVELLNIKRAENRLFALLLRGPKCRTCR
jgi:hypothetical protein